MPTLRKGFTPIKSGFTLIELLVVITIVGILVGLSVFGLQGSRESSRDARRKADLELIRSGIEIYKSDCLNYPMATYNTNWPAQIAGDGTPSSCAVSNVYLSSPVDPASPGRYYVYSSGGVTYELCAALEQGTGSVTCGGSSNCGETCNYKVINP
ncbi:type II secretion system protein [Candidatus Woesebacteria bacterium]|nr:type II secretion system protein [Candidatus Woesebacteria bacterium]